MKDIRPALDDIEKLLKSNQTPFEISRGVMEVIENTPMRGTLLADRLSFMGCWDEGAYYNCTCESCLQDFENNRKDALEVVGKIKTLDWPDSSNALVVSYSKPGAGFGLKILIQVSGLRVECPYEDLKKEIEKSIAGLNQNQSAENFLLNAVYVLPQKYREYKLEL